MVLPIREKSASWVIKHLGIDSDELKKTRTARGTHLVAVLDSVLYEIITDIDMIKKRLGLGSTDLSLYADRLIDLTECLMTGLYPSEKTWFKELCHLWANVGVYDYHLLREFWALKYPAGRIAEKLALKAQHTKIPSQLKVRALENLMILEKSPIPHIPVSF